ncbi:MAG TPA: ATP-binding protein [Candidatus Blautia merdigallinarum]|uniref:ATP-binding protein n=1 Tax=Candidatus Blautia merdigallinarum TaxID=2838495 RepID=A0A9D2SJY1_9FIRM|nr:ATP-binding protein [Candidatus Blautia merdigallinarum]
MRRYASPYTPGAGAMPRYLAGREGMLEEADKILEAVVMGYPQKSVIYYGLRGVGKTVLLNAVEEKAEELNVLYTHIEIAEKRSFIIQIANASKKIIHRMSVVESAKALGHKALGILQAFQVTYNPEEQTFTAGLSEPSMYISSGVLSDDLTEMFVAMGRMAAKAQKAICFFIDEIQYMKSNEMEALINALHRANQLRLPIIVYGAGLPKILKILGDVKSYSERLFQYIEVAELSEPAAVDAIVKPAVELGVKYEEEAVEEIKEWSKGYPFFIQELCNTIWEETEGEIIKKSDVEHVIPIFLDKLDKGFFKIRFDRCTKKEHDFLFAMIRCGNLPCTISNVAEVLEKKVSSVSPTRAQLISKGIIIYAFDGQFRINSF